MQGDKNTKQVCFHLSGEAAVAVRKACWKTRKKIKNLINQAVVDAYAHYSEENPDGDFMPEYDLAPDTTEEPVSEN